MLRGVAVKCCPKQESGDLSSPSNSPIDFGYITYCPYQFPHLSDGGDVLKETYVILQFCELYSQI